MPFFRRKFHSYVLRSVLMCAPLLCWRGRKVATGWLFDFFFLPPGATAEMQSHNNGWLPLPGKRWGGFFWGGGAGGVYLSHGNWFAGVEVGSFEKTSFSLTPSHLSVWKAAGRTGRGREGEEECCCRGIFIQRLEKVSMSEGSIWCQPKMKDASFFFCILPNSACFSIRWPSHYNT